MESNDAKTALKSLKASSQELRRLGAITSRQGILKHIEVIDPDTGEDAYVDVYVRKTSLRTFLHLQDQDKDSKTPGATLIAHCLFQDPECKKPVLSQDEVLDLDPFFAQKIFAIIEEVNQGPKKHT